MGAKEQGPFDDDVNRVIHAVDVFATKVRLADHPGEEAVASWREVGRAVNKSLQRIVVGVFGLPPDVLRLARKLVQCIGEFGAGSVEIPRAIARRIGAGRAIADSKEDQAQAAALDRRTAAALPPPPTVGPVPALASGVATPIAVAAPDDGELTQQIAGLEAVFAELERQGLAPAVVQLAPNRFGIILVPRDQHPQATANALNALRRVHAVPERSGEADPV